MVMGLKPVRGSPQHQGCHKLGPHFTKLAAHAQHMMSIHTRHQHARHQHTRHQHTSTPDTSTSVLPTRATPLPPRALQGYTLSAYCVAKMLTSAKALVFGEDFTADPVGKFISRLLQKVVGGRLPVDTALLSQALTLLFIGEPSRCSMMAVMVKGTVLGTSTTVN
jgi:hypothetical protein